jgi:outer membrane protein assembly factor BamD
MAVAGAAAMPACSARGPQAPRVHKPPKPVKDKYAGIPAREIYDLAMRKLKHRSYFGAREILQKVLGRQDATPELVALVHLALADAYFYDGGVLNLAEAQSRYTNFLTFYPNHERADYAQYQLGLCYLKQTASPDRDQGQARKALAELGKVKTNYPSSEFVAAADGQADKARELLAEHDFRIGNFYFRRKAYTGAVRRLRDVLDAYPNYSRKDRLYLILGQSLMGIDKSEEGRLYLEKLLAEFPKSRHAGQARELLRQPLQTAGTGR